MPKLFSLQWAHMDSNHGPRPYQGRALTKLSYAPDRVAEKPKRLTPTIPERLKRFPYFIRRARKRKGKNEKISKKLEKIFRRAPPDVKTAAFRTLRLFRSFSLLRRTLRLFRSFFRPRRNFRRFRPFPTRSTARTRRTVPFRRGAESSNRSRRLPERRFLRSLRSNCANDGSNASFEARSSVARDATSARRTSRFPKRFPR